LTHEIGKYLLLLALVLLILALVHLLVLDVLGCAAVVVLLELLLIRGLLLGVLVVVFLL
jgi:hypothetical protein